MRIISRDIVLTELPSKMSRAVSLGRFCSTVLRQVSYNALLAFVTSKLLHLTHYFTKHKACYAESAWKMDLLWSRSIFFVLKVLFHVHTFIFEVVCCRILRANFHVRDSFDTIAQIYVNSLFKYWSTNLITVHVATLIDPAGIQTAKMVASKCAICSS